MNYIRFICAKGDQIVLRLDDADERMDRHDRFMSMGRLDSFLVASQNQWYVIADDGPGVLGISDIKTVLFNSDGTIDEGPYNGPTLLAVRASAEYSRFLALVPTTKELLDPTGLVQDAITMLTEALTSGALPARLQQDIEDLLKRMRNAYP